MTQGRCGSLLHIRMTLSFTTPRRFSRRTGEHTMSKHLESLYQNLLNGKLPHNLSWSEAVELVEHLGGIQPHGDDEFVFRVGSQRVFFKRPHTHDLGVEEVSRLRKFLKEAEPGVHVQEPSRPSRMIVVIDHHAA